MALVPAVCSQCGAQLEVDNTLDAGICKFCGTAFVIEKAIHNYTTNITNNIVNINTSYELEELISAGESFLRLNKLALAKKTYESITQKFHGLLLILQTLWLKED